MYIPNVENFFHGGTKRSVEEILKAAVPMQERLLLQEDDISGRKIRFPESADEAPLPGPQLWPEEAVKCRLQMRLSGTLLHVFSGKRRLGTIRVSVPGHMRSNGVVQVKGEPLTYRIEGNGEFIKEYRLSANGTWIAGAVYREWWFSVDENSTPKLRRFEVAAVQNNRTRVKAL